MNLLDMFFKQFWTGNIVLLSHFKSILKQVHVTKKIEKFYHWNKFFYVVIKALTIILYMDEANCENFKAFKAKVGACNWEHFISEVEEKNLGI